VEDANRKAAERLAAEELAQRARWISMVQRRLERRKLTACMGGLSSVLSLPRHVLVHTAGLLNALMLCRRVASIRERTT
jgi:hypothetical protein